MSRAPTRPGQPLEPVTAVCAARYFADLVPAHAFVFRLPSTDSRFTLYTADPDRYLIGATYTLTLAEPGERSLSLTPRTGSCSRTASNGWPNGGPTPSNRPIPEPGHNQGPNSGRSLMRLRRRVGPLLDPTDGAETTGGEGESS